jgi:hypothetical protein
MPSGEFARPFRINTLHALLSCLLVICSSPAAAQSISSVTVSKKPGTGQETADFTLRISGKDFGGDKSKISVVLTPTTNISQIPVVTDVAKGGNALLATFTAPEDYTLETVTVQVNGSTSAPYALPAVTAAAVAPAAAAAPEKSDQQKYIRVYRAVIDPLSVSDIFGRRIAKRFVVIQVTVANTSPDYQYLIHDVSLDVSKMLNITGGYRMSSADLTLLRGVAEKGQNLDPRNVTLRILRGAGTVAAGLIGVARFGKSYAPAVAMWSGPLVSAYETVFPDYTINEMNRLNDSAYAANALVPKQQSKVMAAFIPQAIFMSPDQQKAFWKDPTSIQNAIDWRLLSVLVDGDLITNISDVAPALTSATIDANEMKNFQADKPEVKGSISGKYLTGTEIKLLNSDLPGVAIRVDGTPSDQKVDFIVNSNLPVAPGKVLKLGVSKKGQDAVKETDVAITYSSAAPTLTKVDLPSLTQGDQDKVITLTGTNFLPSATQVLIAPTDGVTVASVDVKSSTSLEAKATVTSTAPTSGRQITVVTLGGSSSGLALTINKKQ